MSLIFFFSSLDTTKAADGRKVVEWVLLAANNSITWSAPNSPKIGSWLRPSLVEGWKWEQAQTALAFWEEEKNIHLPYFHKSYQLNSSIPDSYHPNRGSRELLEWSSKTAPWDPPKTELIVGTEEACV